MYLNKDTSYLLNISDSVSYMTKGYSLCIGLNSVDPSHCVDFRGIRGMAI